MAIVTGLVYTIPKTAKKKETKDEHSLNKLSHSVGPLNINVNFWFIGHLCISVFSICVCYLENCSKNCLKGALDETFAGH